MLLNNDRSVKLILVAIAIFLGLIALRPLFEPRISVQAQAARFDHVFVVSTVFLYKGAQGLLVLDKRNGNVWFFPRVADAFQDPVFVTHMPFDKLDQTPPR